jgi:putative MATE family efflux protein
MAKQSTTAKLGTESIGKLLLQYSLPAIVATAAASLYNIIDRIFIGHGVGPLAISGLSLTLPLMNLAAAFGAMVGIGASTMVSIRLGQNDRQGASRILGNALMLNIIISAIFSVVTFIFLDPILIAMGASDQTLPYARQFMQVILIGNNFMHIYLGLNNIMRSSGHPQKAMLTTLMTVALNLIFAPIFIFVFNWGIRGAALSTVLAQLFGAIFVISHFSKRSGTIYFLPGYFRLKKAIVSDIFSIGIANFLMLTCSSLVIILINRSLGKYGGDYAIGAYGIINSILNLVMMIVIGLNQGMQPISGYNFGATQYDRVKKVFKLTIIAATCVTTMGFLAAEIFPRQIAGFFTSNEELINLSTSGMRIALMVFPIVGFQMVTTSFFQSIGRASTSIVLSLSRQMLFLIPLVLILPHFWGLDGIWMAMPVSDLLASIITLTMLKIQVSRNHFLKG